MLYSCMVTQGGQIYIYIERERGKERERERVDQECCTTYLIGAEEMIRNNNGIYVEFYYTNFREGFFSLHKLRAFTKMLSCWMSVLWYSVLDKFMDNSFWATLHHWEVRWLGFKGMCSEWYPCLAIEVSESTIVGRRQEEAVIIRTVYFPYNTIRGT